MEKIDIQKILSEAFPKLENSDWKRIATTEVNGGDPFNQLIWKDSDGIEHLPYYDKKTLQSYGENEFYRSSSNTYFLGNRSWFNTPVVTVTDELSANKKALHHLQNGAEGIIFNLQHNSISFQKLLAGIQWEHCTLSFYGDVSAELVNSLHRYKSENKIVSGKGNIFWKESPLVIHDNIVEDKVFRSLGCFINSSTPVKEISDALTSAVKSIESHTSRLNTEKIIRSISFSLPVHNNFLVEISKFKALRMLWYQVVRAYGMESYLPGDLHIHSRIEPWASNEFQPHESMLKGSISAMASIIGGADSLTVYPHDEDNAMIDRIARNISNILRDESHFSKVEDPLAGAYAIEAMVNEIAEKAWIKFQTNQKN
jgi:methylmalonyl-CoA mutase